MFIERFMKKISKIKVESFSGNFAVIIGPEGGFSAKENENFSSICKNISLSKTILRAEVAASGIEPKHLFSKGKCNGIF